MNVVRYVSPLYHTVKFGIISIAMVWRIMQSRYNAIMTIHFQLPSSIFSTNVRYFTITYTSSNCLYIGFIIMDYTSLHLLLKHCASVILHISKYFVSKCVQQKINILFRFISWQHIFKGNNSWMPQPSDCKQPFFKDMGFQK